MTASRIPIPHPRRAVLLATAVFAAFWRAPLAPGRAPETDPAPAQQAAASAPPVRAVLSTGMTVGDLDRSIAFYTGILGFQTVSRSEQAGDGVEHLTGVFGARTLTGRLRLGSEEVELVQYLAASAPGRPIPVDSRSNDRWFQHIAIAVSDMDRAYAHLRAHTVAHASSGPQTLPQNLSGAAGISAFYFKDPDGHVLEIIRFPPGKGDPRWQPGPEPGGNSGALFLGIDHTAIAIADTETSLRFYRDKLGLRVAGGSENFGTEQEHLNNVFGARLRITALRAGAGPGVELLEYLAPSGGRPYPPDSRPSDLWHWQTTFDAPNLSELAAQLRSAHATSVSTGVVEDDSAVGALMLRDPDGHAILLTHQGR